MRYALVGILWLVLAVTAGALDLLAALRPPGPQLILVGLTLGLLTAAWRSAGFREWLHRLSWRPLVALHLSRLVGIWFLVLHQRGELPYLFAVPGGIGDIAVAVLAAGLLAGGRIVARHPWLLRAWNVAGLIDILFVVATAARLGMADPGSMAALLRLPLSLLPTWLVPLIVASHVWLFRVTVDPGPRPEVTPVDAGTSRP